MVYIAKGSFWINLNFISSSLVSFLVSVIFAWFVSKETYGIYQYVLSIAAIISAFSLTGMNTAVTQSVAKGMDGSLVYSTKAQLRWSIFMIIGSFSVGGYYLMGSRIDLFLAFILVAIFLPFSNAFNTYSAFLSGKKDFKKVFEYNTAFNIFYLIGIFTTAYFTPYPLVLICVFLSIGAIGNYRLYRKTVEKFNLSENNFDQNIMSYGAHLSFINILSTIVNRADSILVFHYLGPATLAVYTFAKAIPDRVTSLFKSILSISLPKLSEKNYSEIKNHFHLRMTILATLSLVAATIISLLIPLIYKKFFPQYIDSILYARIYTFTIIIAVSIFSGMVLIAKKTMKDLYLLNIVNPILQLLILFFLVRSMGIFGAVIAKVLGQVISLSISWIVVSQAIRTNSNN
jgi:O-antigen/teichoic acid export membrane protein